MDPAIAEGLKDHPHFLRMIEVLMEQSDSESEGPPGEVIRNQPVAAQVVARPQDVEEEAERIKLLNIIVELEAHYRENFERSQGSPEAAREYMSVVYRRIKSDIGFHVDIWPPRPISSNLHLHKVSDGLRTDRITFLKAQIDAFLGRAQRAGEEIDNSVVVLVNSDEVIDKIVNSPLFQSYRKIVIKQSDLVQGQSENLNNLIGNFVNDRNNSILICNQNLVSFSTVPFAKMNIFHQVTDKHLFFHFIDRLTYNSRLHKVTTQIHVPLNFLDEPDIVEYVAKIAALRGEEVTTNLLDFVEDHCWNQNIERAMFMEWALRIKAQNKTAENRARRILGIHVENWWNNDEKVRQVARVVKPTKEIVEPGNDRPWRDFAMSESEDEEITRM